MAGDDSHTSTSLSCELARCELAASDDPVGGVPTSCPSDPPPCPAKAAPKKSGAGDPSPSGLLPTMPAYAACRNCMLVPSGGLAGFLAAAAAAVAGPLRALAAPLPDLGLQAAAGWALFWQLLKTLRTKKLVAFCRGTPSCQCLG